VKIDINELVPGTMILSTFMSRKEMILIIALHSWKVDVWVSLTTRDDGRVSIEDIHIDHIMKDSNRVIA